MIAKNFSSPMLVEEYIFEKKLTEDSITLTRTSR